MYSMDAVRGSDLTHRHREEKLLLQLLFQLERVLTALMGAPRKLSGIWKQPK